MSRGSAMLTRVPLAFDLSLISAPASTVAVTATPMTPEVVLFVTCPCIGGGGGGLVLHHATRVTDPFDTFTATPMASSCYLGPQITPNSNNPTNLSPSTTLSNPRWCFPDPNNPSCASAPTTPTPASFSGKGSAPPCFPAPAALSAYSNDFERLRGTQSALKTCGFYYEGITWQRASELLRGASVGTFLVRESADPRHLYSLSVQTDRGPTSVRIHYSGGRFRLDCEDNLIHSMPTFDCVLKLVEHYVRLSQTAKGKSCVWLDGSGKRDLKVRLYRPLYRRVPSLQHAARTACRAILTKNGLSEDDLDLPSVVKDYLKDYPYWL